MRFMHGVSSRKAAFTELQYLRRARGTNTRRLLLIPLQRTLESSNLKTNHDSCVFSAGSARVRVWYERAITLCCQSELFLKE